MTALTHYTLFLLTPLHILYLFVRLLLSSYILLIFLMPLVCVFVYLFVCLLCGVPPLCLSLPVWYLCIPPDNPSFYSFLLVCTTGPSVDKTTICGPTYLCCPASFWNWLYGLPSRGSTTLIYLVVLTLKFCTSLHTWNLRVTPWPGTNEYSIVLRFPRFACVH